MRGSFLSTLPLLAAVGSTTSEEFAPLDPFAPVRVFSGSGIKQFGMYCRATRRNGNKRTKRCARKFRKTNKY